MKKLFLRESKLWVGEFPEVPPVSSSANQDAARMRSYDREFEYAKKIAIEVVNDKEVTRIIIEQDEQPTYWKECLLSDQLYDIPSGWTVEYGENCFGEVASLISIAENIPAGTVATGTPEAEHANEEPVCISQFASAEEFYQAHIESKEPLKGFKRRIIDHVRNNPMESECDLTDVVLGLEEILKEYREAYLKTVSPPSQAESESQDQLWHIALKHAAFVDFKWVTEQFIITRKMKQ